MRRLLVALPLLVLAVAGCTDDGSDGKTAAPEAARSNGPLPVVQVKVGTADPVKAEVADDDKERELGLMERKSVPLGTGMVFRYDKPVDAKYYMFHVPVQLTAVFAREGKVVGVTLMAPCPFANPDDCPVYGPDQPYDTVLETAPGTVAGKVKIGDPLQVLGG